MIRSMTGFGRFEDITPEHKITAEIKAVNHRYLDLTIKMPKRFNCFEARIRSLLKKYIQRGKVDVFISYENYAEQKFCVKYNEALAAEYMDYFKKMEDQFGIENDVKVSMLARMPEVLFMESALEDEEQVWKLVSWALEEASKPFVESRTQEGERLRQDLFGKLDYMEERIDFIEQRSPTILTEYQKKLETKVKELLENNHIEESRIVTEVALFADKICVDEETVRLRSHIKTTRKELEDGKEVGRKLDFIAQEMNREANTILSKSQDLQVSNCAIALKTEIDKVREHIQNIE